MIENKIKTPITLFLMRYYKYSFIFGFSMVYLVGFDVYMSQIMMMES